MSPMPIAYRLEVLGENKWWEEGDEREEVIEGE